MTRSASRHTRTGATLPLVALSLVALLGLAALAVDVAGLYAARQRAQTVADAAALAAGPLLPATGQASAAATQVIGANGAAFAGAQVTFPATATADDKTVLAVGAGNAVTVSGYVNAPLSFAPAVGYRPTSRDGRANTVSVTAQATVAVQTACGLPAQTGVAPFGIVGDDPNNTNTALKLAYTASLLSTTPDSQTPQPRVYQPVKNQVTLRLTMWDRTGRPIGGGAGNCDPLQLSSPPNLQSDLAGKSGQSYTAGQALTTLPNSPATVVMAAQQGINRRLAPSDTAFTHDFTSNGANFSGSAYAEWFFGDPTKPVDTALPPVTDTDPNTGQTSTFYYHKDPHRQEATDAHLLIVPIVSQGAKGLPGQVTVLAWATFFLEEPLGTGSTYTGNGLALGRFIGLTVPGTSGGSCTGAGAKTPPRLVG